MNNCIQDFLILYNPAIKTIYNSLNCSYDEFYSKLISELENSYNDYCNGKKLLSDLNDHLFYSINLFAGKFPTIKNKTQYLCPGCLFFGKNNVIFLDKDVFKCNECSASLKTIQDLKKVNLFKTFAIHNKRGYKCPNCKRFIPANDNVVICPYLDCYFVGDDKNLKKMHHPNSQSNIVNFSKNETANEVIVINPNILEKVKIISEVIESQSNSLPYSSSNFTLIHKASACQAFANLLNSYPDEMVNYLMYNSRTGGFQHKIFQEYISILEKSIPFSYKKGNKTFKVDSLLDTNLFDGISVFNSIVSDKLEIKNNTSEFYIGGRSASYIKPYYIGKLLNIIDNKTQKSLIEYVQEYSFSKIKMKNISSNIEVTVTHLRVPPHYQMGGMVYINRLRKNIVDFLEKYE